MEYWSLYVANIRQGWFRVCPGAMAIWNKKVRGLRKRQRSVTGLGRRRVARVSWLKVQYYESGNIDQYGRSHYNLCFHFAIKA